MNNKVLLSSLLRSPWLMDDAYADKYLQLADDYLSRLDISIPERSIRIQFAQGSTVTAKDYRSDIPISETFKNLQPDTTVIIPVSGALTKYDVCGWYGMQSMASLFNAAAAEPNVSAIVAVLDTPGGSADGSLDLALAIEQAAAVKPVVAYIDGLCASAGYRVACRATSIIAKPDSIIGSIGTMISLQFRDAQQKMQGIENVTINADASPDKNNDVQQAKIGNYQLIKDSILNPLNDSFTGEVKNFRKGVSADALTGKVFTSAKALQLHLIDGEGMLNDAINAAQSSSQKIKPNMKLSDKLKQFFGITEDVNQLTEQHTAQLETLLADKETAQQTIDQHAQTIATQKTTLDAVQALFPGQTDLVTAIKDVQAKAALFDAADGAKNTRVDKENEDSKDKDADLKQQLDKLPHHQKLMNKFPHLN